MFLWKFVKVHEIKAFLIKPIWAESGLGKPSIEFTTNDVESENFIIKYGLHFDKKNPQKFIERVKEVFSTQFKIEDRAVFGKGTYRLQKGFKRCSVDDFQCGN